MHHVILRQILICSSLVEYKFFSPKSQHLASYGGSPQLQQLCRLLTLQLELDWEQGTSSFQVNFNIFIFRKTYKHFSHDKQRNISFTDKDHFHGTLGGMVLDSDGFKMHDIWLVFQALGNIAFAYSYSMILIEIQVSYLFYWKKNYFNLL